MEFNFVIFYCQSWLDFIYYFSVHTLCWYDICSLFFSRFILEIMLLWKVENDEFKWVIVYEMDVMKTSSFALITEWKFGDMKIFLMVRIRWAPISIAMIFCFCFWFHRMRRSYRGIILYFSVISSKFAFE